jgi:hypothetical protein
MPRKAKPFPSAVLLQMIDRLPLQPNPMIVKSELSRIYARAYQALTRARTADATAAAQSVLEAVCTYRQNQRRARRLARWTVQLIE